MQTSNIRRMNNRFSHGADLPSRVPQLGTLRTNGFYVFNQLFLKRSLSDNIETIEQ